MTPAQYKKLIQSLPREQVEEHLFTLFGDAKVFRDLENTFWDKGANGKLLEQLQKKLSQVFWKNSFSLGECRSVLKAYTEKTTDRSTLALMHLAFASEAAQLSASVGDFDSSFYTALVKAAEKYLEYAATDPEFFRKHEEDFQDLIDTCGEFGYGVADELEMRFDGLQFELFGDEAD